MAIDISDDVTVFRLDDLTEEDGIKLLEQIAPEVVKAERSAASELVREVSALPLALAILGKYLAKQNLFNNKKIIHQAIIRLKEAGVRIGITNTKGSLKTAIDFSYNALGPNTQNALRAISHFRPNPNFTLPSQS
ncbi:MAG: hypothetical protein ABR924_14285 [Terracidiphilus sp.]